MTIRCDTCRFWQKFSLSDDGPFPKVTPGTGQCRYHPPVLDQKAYEYDRSDDAADCARWPITWDGHWCGQHQPPLADFDMVEAAERRRERWEQSQREQSA